MGFTGAQYPTLNAKGDTRLSRGGEVSKSREESIVAEIIDDLLVSSPRRDAAEASGSGARRP